MKPDTPAADAVAKQPRATKRPLAGAADAAPSAASAEGRDEAIRHMAYLLYVERGCVDGHEVEDWLRAEALVSQQAAGNAPAAEKVPKAAAKRVPAAAAANKAAAPAAKRAPAKPRSK